MKAIQNKKKLADFHTTFEKIFRDYDPFGEMFQDWVNKRLILCPIDGYYLKENQFRALLKSIQAVGENKIYISEIEMGRESFIPQNGELYQCNHWEYDVSKIVENYLRLPIIVENAIYSSIGRWGIIVSHEEHAVIGGTESFIEQFKLFYPKWEEGLTNFCNKWADNLNKYHSNIGWYLRFLSYVQS
jgi:hypothetical protein